MLLPSIAGVTIPDSRLATEATDVLRANATPLLFAHSLRVYLFGAVRGRTRGLTFDPELLYLGAVFHDLGLTPMYRSPDRRFEIDGANAARDFLRAHGIHERDIEVVWDAIALHTSPEIPWYKRPEVALVQGGVEVDVIGVGLDEIPPADRDAVLTAFPRTNFKQGIVQAFAEGFADKPATTFGTMNADILEAHVPGFRRTNFCTLIADNPLSG